VGYFYNRIDALEKEQEEKRFKIDTTTTVVKPSEGVVDILDLPSVKRDKDSFEEVRASSNFDYIPRLVDKSIRLPITKDSEAYKKVKQLAKEHMDYAALELDYNKLEKSQDHVEAAIYYLRNIH
jgi:hypothetical protein